MPKPPRRGPSFFRPEPPMQTASDSTKILFLGSNVKITNMPVKEVSLLEEGSLPAYGYNPGDNIVLLAGPVTIEHGRLEQCLTWLSAYLVGSELRPKINTLSYGGERQVYQLFRKRRSGKDGRAEGWFMTKQILPAEERGAAAPLFTFSGHEYEIAGGNAGMVLIDDSGMPPQICDEMCELNPGMWCVALGISVAHWQHWAKLLGERFTLFCRLSDLETTRMEMDSSVNWETIVAMCLRALRTPEVGLWDSGRHRFLCGIIIEMFPHAILYVGPEAVYFRCRKGSLPEKSSSRKRGSVPCYDTMVTAMLTLKALRSNGLDFSRRSFYDFSKQVLCNWQRLNEHGYHFDEGLRLPTLDCSSACLSGLPCSCAESREIDPTFIELPYFTPEFEENLEHAAGQAWGEKKKKALRSLFRHQYDYPYPRNEDAPLHYIDIIMSVLHCLKEEVNRDTGFDNLPIFKLGHLRTTDPAEIDPVLTLHQVMDSYVSKESVLRPLCIGVFGPPGSGKSFAVKQVANEISRHYDSSPFVFFEFNLTQFASPDEINAAIDPIRASVAQGKVPIAFWDEFDCRYDGHEFGYLRYFLPAMQDGVTYVQGIPYHIGRAIFVFAGGVKASWEGMERLLTPKKPKDLQLIKTLKIPDFMSRLRVVLDIDGIEVPEYLLKDSASAEELEELRRILLKRAFIISHQMHTHWKSAARKTSGLLLRLLLADYKFGARSIEAVIEASRAADRLVYGLPELIAPSAARIHAEWRVDLERKIDQFRKAKGLRAVW